MELLPHDARRRTKTGTVVSDRMNKTVVVAVETFKRHRLYGRSVRRTKRYHAHDEANLCKLGDRVVIAESRPISKTKFWRVREIIGHDVVAALPKVEDLDLISSPGTAAATSREASVGERDEADRDEAARE